MNVKKIIVDIFGADAGPEPIIQGSLRALKQHPDLGIVFVGDAQTVCRYCRLDQRIELIETSDYITNQENPQVIFAGRDSCSIALAYQRLKSDADCVGMISAGSTGALLIGSIRRLGLFPGLMVPALSTYMPVYTGKMVCLLDCGANVQCTPKDLVNFAIMGNAFYQSMNPGCTPRVALLSVGKEAGKGCALQKEAYPLLQQLPLHFIGNMEGNDLVTGYADVVVTDGFSGNVLLKNTEAAGKVAMGIVAQTATEFGKQTEPFVQTALAKLNQTFELNTRGGATFLGTAKPVIKMHGCATEETPVACIDQLLRMEAAGFSQAVAKALAAKS